MLQNTPTIKVTKHAIGHWFTRVKPGSKVAELKSAALQAGAADCVTTAKACQFFRYAAFRRERRTPALCAGDYILKNSSYGCVFLCKTKRSGIVLVISVASLKDIDHAAL